jgi:hypothetical protein
MIIPILDACRHLLDAFPKSFDPLKTPGLILLDRPNRFCTAKRFPDWIKLMDELLPNMQFVVALTDRASTQFPLQLRKKRLANYARSALRSIKARPASHLSVNPFAFALERFSSLMLMAVCRILH